MTKSNGAILWRGASLLDGQPIVAIAVGLANGSSNEKTGAMLQTYILRSDMTPIEAVHTGNDVSICGDCPHRGDGTGKMRTCYVQLQNAPTGIYKAFRAGSYPGVECISDVGAKRVVRIGSYGDPAAVPTWVWDALVSEATAHTGYTHQWRTRSDLRHLVMASADTSKDASVAHAAGWRTFRVALPGHIDRLPREAVCPASAEAGRKLTCSQCRACNGAGTGTRGSVVISVHGGTAVMSNVARLVAVAA
jgi:hypothetical protein